MLSIPIASMSQENKKMISNKNLPYILYPEDLGSNSKQELMAYFSSKNHEIFAKLHEHAALLFRGFNLSSSLDFKEVITYLTTNLLTYVGGDSPRDKLIEGIYNSTTYPADQFISMHNEKSFSKHYPSLLWFFCELEPTMGGETPLLDGRRLYQLLDKNIIEKFSLQKLKYVMNLHSGDGIGKSWQDTFQVNNRTALEDLLKNLNIDFYWKSNGLLRIEEIVSPVIEHPVTKEKVFFSQADQWHPSNLDSEVLDTMLAILPEEDFYHNCYYGDGTIIDGSDLDAIRKVVGEELVPLKWKKGDLLLIDNILALHGRFPYQGDRKILVAMC